MQAEIADPATRELMRRIELTVDAGIDAAFPNRRAAIVTITTKDGRSEQMLQPTRKGDPDLPLTDRELDEKYLELAIPVIGKAKAAVLLERLWQLDAKPGVDLH